MDTISILVLATFSVTFLLALFVALWMMMHRIYLLVNENTESCKHMQSDVKNMGQRTKEMDDKINAIRQHTQLTYNQNWQDSAPKQPEKALQQMTALFGNLSQHPDTPETDSSLSMAEKNLMSHMKNLRSELQS